MSNTDAEIDASLAESDDLAKQLNWQFKDMKAAVVVQALCTVLGQQAANHHPVDKRALQAALKTTFESIALEAALELDRPMA